MRAMRAVLAVAAALFLLLPAAPASAHISELQVLAYGGTCLDEHCEQLDYDSVEGSITCAAGEKFLVTAKIVDSPSYAGKGRTKGTCTGTQQAWEVVLTNEQGVGDTACPIRVSAKAHTKVNGTGHDEARDSFPSSC